MTLPVRSQGQNSIKAMSVQGWKWTSKKTKRQRSRGKVLATVFWDVEGILLIDFLEGKKTITPAYYECVLRKLSKKSQKNILEICIHASSSTTTVHPLTALGRQELWYVNFDGKSLDIHLAATI